MTPWQKHKEKWINCTLCDLCHVRKNVVLFRGSIPAPVLLIGEGPGESEDVLGKPFSGPAGKLLDYIISQAGLKQGQFAITNLIACIPKEEGNKLSVPPKESVLACADRLNEIGEMVNPNLVVAVGQEAKKWLPKVAKGQFLDALIGQMIDIIHPAAVLRMNIASQGLAIQRTIVSLSDALEECGIC